MDRIRSASSKAAHLLVTDATLGIASVILKEAKQRRKNVIVLIYK